MEVKKKKARWAWINASGDERIAEVLKVTIITVSQKHYSKIGLSVSSDVTKRGAEPCFRRRNGCECLRNTRQNYSLRSAHSKNSALLKKKTNLFSWWILNRPVWLTTSAFKLCPRQRTLVWEAEQAEAEWPPLADKPQTRITNRVNNQWKTMQRSNECPNSFSWKLLKLHELDDDNILQIMFGASVT